MQADTVRAGGDRYHTFLSLSADGIARFELARRSRTTPRTSRSSTSSATPGRRVQRAFAAIYGRGAAEMLGHAGGGLHPARRTARRRSAIHAPGYRLVYSEEEHHAPTGPRAG